MLGSGENISENLSGYLFTLGVALHKGTGGGGQNLFQSEAAGFQSVCQQKIKAVLGMLGSGENISENLSGCLFTLGVSLQKGTGGGGADRTYFSQRQ